MKDDDLIKVPIPPKLELADPAYNPAFDVDTPQYKWVTVAEYRHEQDEKKHKSELEWYEKHKRADALIVNQTGEPLYALYQTPAAEHEQMVSHLFRQLRADRLNSWEIED